MRTNSPYLIPGMAAIGSLLVYCARNRSLSGTQANVGVEIPRFSNIHQWILACAGMMRNKLNRYPLVHVLDSRPDFL